MYQMVLAKISSIIHEQVLNLYVFKSRLLKFQTAKTSGWKMLLLLVFPHCRVCKSFFFILSRTGQYCLYLYVNAFHFNNKLNQLDLCRKSRWKEC